MGSYEYFGHDAVVRIQPESEALPELVVRITGGPPLAPGTRFAWRMTIDGESLPGASLGFTTRPRPIAP